MLAENAPECSSNHYQYDAIGNLIKDGSSTISWNVYGKIEKITKEDGATITYSYDAAGNRISKTVGDKLTVYVRDASGNVMSVYEKSASTALKQIETHLYGSSRLGIVGELSQVPQSINLAASYAAAKLSTFTRGEKAFELSNHLGNVLVTISDKKIAVPSQSNSSLIDHYEAVVVSAQDYYPFGMLMPGRTSASASYRYGYNGKENVSDVKGSLHQDYHI